MSEARVISEISNGVAHVRLNRPDKRNGLDLAMFEAIDQAAATLAADRSVRAIVLSGEGKAFCAGLDWQAFMQLGAEIIPRLMTRDEATNPANMAQRVGWRWAQCPVPVIAAISGAAFGGGLQIALGADIRILAPNAQLSVMEVRYGLIPDMSASKTLLRLVRPDVAKELTFTGRIVAAEEAVRLGLATAIEPDPVAAALALAKTIAEKSPHAIRAGKTLIDRAPELSVLEAFKLESALQQELLGSPNQMAAVAAVMSGQPAVFSDIDAS